MEPHEQNKKRKKTTKTVNDSLVVGGSLQLEIFCFCLIGNIIRGVLRTYCLLYSLYIVEEPNNI